MLQVRQPPSNPLLLQEAGEVHCGHHTSTTAGTVAALCSVPRHAGAFAFCPGCQDAQVLPPQTSIPATAGEHTMHFKMGFIHPAFC